MTTTIIHLIRHGEVDNPDGILYGRLPGFGLTERGHQMAATVADHFAAQKRDITTVIASPLQRTQETAAPIAAAFNVPVESDERLIESANKFEGLSINADRRQLTQPKHWKHYLRPLQPSWGEPYVEVAARMRAAVSAALRTAEGHEAVLVSHQLPIVTLTRFIQGLPLPHSPFNRNCSLASVTSLIFQNHTLVGMTYEEPAAWFLGEAQDMTPGNSAAQLKR